MTSTLGGDDEAHDFPTDDKDRVEKALRKEAEELRKRGKAKERQKKLDRANEISRQKSKRNHQ